MSFWHDEGNQHVSNQTFAWWNLVLIATSLLTVSILDAVLICCCFILSNVFLCVFSRLAMMFRFNFRRCGITAGINNPTLPCRWRYELWADTLLSLARRIIALPVYHQVHLSKLALMLLFTRFLFRRYNVDSFRLDSASFLSQLRLISRLLPFVCLHDEGNQHVSNQTFVWWSFGSHRCEPSDRFYSRCIDVLLLILSGACFVCLSRLARMFRFNFRRCGITAGINNPGLPCRWR